jgi:two-component system NarL family response regulator
MLYPPMPFPEKAFPVIRILVADDHPVMRTGLSLMLQHEPDMEVVADASNGAEAVALFRQHRPDIALMDLRMSEMDGAEATRVICEEFPSARIILLSMHDGSEDVYRGLQAGAKAYLLKDATCEEILETIRMVHAGQKRITGEVAAKLVERMTGPELTEREWEVVQLLVKGYGNQEIATALSVSEGTVKFHVNHILRKLDVSDRTQAILIALKRGIASLN